MNKEVILAKLNQIKNLIFETKKVLSESLDEFETNFTLHRTAERNLQLMVDIASDINAEIIIDKTGIAPETYKKSFRDLEKQRVISPKLARELVNAAGLRNIIVHEYDFDADPSQVYISGAPVVKAFEEYIRQINKLVRK